jgi:hypothetical protein
MAAAPCALEAWPAELAEGPFKAGRGASSSTQKRVRCCLSGRHGWVNRQLCTQLRARGNIGLTSAVWAEVNGPEACALRLMPRL